MDWLSNLLKNTKEFFLVLLLTRQHKCWPLVLGSEQCLLPTPSPIRHLTIWHQKPGLPKKMLLEHCRLSLFSAINKPCERKTFNLSSETWKSPKRALRCYYCRYVLFWGFRDWNGFGDEVEPDEKKIKKLYHLNQSHDLWRSGLWVFKLFF